MIECSEDGVDYLRFTALAEQPGVTHAVFTRRGGVSLPPFASLNASSATGDEAGAVRENKRRMARILGLGLISATPVHEADVVAVVAPDGPFDAWRNALRETEADAMMTDLPGCALFWAYADCMPILLFDPRRPAVALVHAGWRGTARGIAMRTVAAMRERYGTRPEDLLAGLAPSIGTCCYTLTPADREQFRTNEFIWTHTPFAPKERADGAVVYAVDLWESNRAQLLAAGVIQTHIEASEMCTGCQTDAFYSNRIERAGTGRFGVGIGLRPSPGTDTALPPLGDWL